MNPPSSEKVQIGFDLRRKVGDSNPRYGNPYVSLANWWFQPLTQPSKSLEKFLAEPLLSNAMQRYNIFLKPPNFFINFFLISCKSITFCDKHHPFSQTPHLSPTLSISCIYNLSNMHISTKGYKYKRRAPVVRSPPKYK